MECSRADVVELGPFAADWFLSATECFSLLTTARDPLIPAAYRNFAQRLAALG